MWRLLSRRPLTASALHSITRRRLASSTDQNSVLPRIVKTNGVPIHLYSYDLEPQALDQLVVLAESGIPVDYIASMPDAHLGKGVTIGTVFASEKYVCPNAVGVDIGCGMAAIPIEDLYKHDMSDAIKTSIQFLIKERIPTGFSQHTGTLPGTKRILDKITQTIQPSDYLQDQLLLPRVTDQLGSLGGGNHFIELLYETQSNQVWVMLHSGSRNIGNRTASHYDFLAQQDMRKRGMSKQEIRHLNGLNYLLIDSEHGQDYLRDMKWCQ